MIGIASRAMGRLTERVGPRWPLTIGPAVTALGFMLRARIGPGASYWTSVLPGILMIAAGGAAATALLALEAKRSLALSASPAKAGAQFGLRRY